LLLEFLCLKTLYKLDSIKDIKYYFYKPEILDVAGIYCFINKENLSYYIGSSLNIRKRYNRHIFNLKQTNTRYSQANPKFYNLIRKYGLESFDFSCLLITKNYLAMFSGLNLSQEEIALLKSLTQLDLLLTEQFFLDNLGISLNVSSMVGTRESNKLPNETQKK